MKEHITAIVVTDKIIVYSNENGVIYIMNIYTEYVY